LQGIANQPSGQARDGMNGLWGDWHADADHDAVGLPRKHELSQTPPLASVLLPSECAVGETDRSKYESLRSFGLDALGWEVDDIPSWMVSDVPPDYLVRECATIFQGRM